jgi:cobyrinic acid a,c-diamide synthase
VSGVTLGPRVVVAGTHSGVGKTTIATGLMAALTRRAGLRVAPAKVGPDFIDPGYHALATGRPPRNLDPWMSGTDVIAPLAGRAAAGADVLVVEGVMGLFDGAADGEPASTADVAALLDAPVVLVVDAAGASHSIAAVAQGFARFDDRVRVAGVICNRVGSESHAAMLRDALARIGMPMLGALRRDDAFAWRDRHLGLVPVVEHAREVRASIERLADAVARDCDLEAIERVARTAAPRDVAPVALPEHVASVRVALASGPAFSFTYVDNVEALTAAGAEVVPFDPCTEPALPEGCAALVAGGGFPEVYAAALAANTALLADVRRRVDDGMAVWAECGGLLWLARAVDDHPMAGVVPAAARMTDRRTLGYRRGCTRVESPLGRPGTELRGHEFHYSTIEPAGDALTLHGRDGETRSGFAGPRMLASSLHLHLGAAPALAEAFVATAARRP